MNNDDLTHYIEALTKAASAEQSDSKQHTWTEQLSQVTDGVRSTVGFTSRMIKIGPPPPGEESVPVGARLSFAGYVDDLWHARPTPERPYPVVLLHGTISSKAAWQNLVTLLRKDGFAVFAPDYGHHGTANIPDSAADVSAYIDQVLAATGAAKVDIVAHSQGGLLARYLINQSDFDAKVHHLITLSAPHHGTTVNGQLASLLTGNETAAKVAEATVIRFMGVAGMQQVVGSALLTELSRSPQTRPGVRYTCLATKIDTTVVPVESAFLDPDTYNEDGTPVVVDNDYVQDLGAKRVLHNDMPSDLDVQLLVHQKLLAGL